MSPPRCRLHVREHLADREDADRDDDELDAAQQLRAAEREARGRAEQVGAHAGDPQAHQHRQQRLRSAIRPASRTTIARPSTISAKYSGELNASDSFASGGATSISPTTPKVPAMNEAIAAMPERGARAALARHLVAVEAGDTEADSPGTLSRIEVVEPPYFAP